MSSPILEAAFLQITPAQQQAFESDFAKAGQYIRAIEGYRHHHLQRCLEVPGKYLLLVEWESLEAHTVGFRESEGYQHWKALLHHYYDPFPVVEHFERVL